MCYANILELRKSEFQIIFTLIYVILHVLEPYCIHLRHRAQVFERLED